MSEWKEYKLGNIATFSQGIQIDIKNQFNENFEDCVRFIRIVDFTKGAENEIRYIKNPGEKYIVKSDDLVMIRYGSQTAGKIARGFNGVIANNMFKISLDENKSDKNFIYFFLSQQSIYNFFHNSQSSSTMPAITFGMIGDLDIELPPLPEQTAIASILSSLDDKIDLLHRQNATLEKMAETLFRQWFVEGAKEEWEEGKLSCLVESANTGLDAIRKAPIVDNYTGIKCLRIQDISQSKPIVNWGNTAVSDSDYRKAQLKKGDIIMARTCSPGILLHIQEDLPAVFNNGLARIRANKENCHPLFLKYLFKTDLFINHIYGISDGTAVQLNMKLGDLLSFEINIPPKEILESFIEIIKKWDDKILINQSQIRTLTSLRDTLLPKLMSGEVRVEY